MSTAKYRLLLSSILLAATAAHGQEGLSDIYQRALSNDPVIREAEANYLAISEVKAAARSGLLPSLLLSGSASDSQLENPDPPLDFFTGEPSTIFSSTESDSESSGLSLDLNQTVFDWGQYVSLKQADKTIARAETDLAVIRQDLMVRVAEAYFNVLAAEDSLAAQVTARESIGRQLDQARRRFELGMINITNVQEAQAGFDQAGADVIAAERVLATAQEFLREIVDDYVVDLRPPIDELPLLTPDPANVEQWVETARAQNLALISSRIGADIAEDDIKISRSFRFPTLSLSASSSDTSLTSRQTTNLFGGGSIVTDPTRNQRQSSSVSLSLSVPIYSGGANRSAVRQSVHLHRAAMENLERVARRTERETRDAFLGVMSEISRVEALRQALESSQTALRATEAELEVGQRTVVDLLVAQDNLRRAETTYARSRYDYILNLLRLKQAAGSLSVADIAEVDSWLE